MPRLQSTLLTSIEYLLVAMLTMGCTYSSSIKDSEVQLTESLRQYERLPWSVRFNERSSTFDAIEGQLAGTGRTLKLKTEGLEPAVKVAIESMFTKTTDPGSADLECQFDLLSISTALSVASCELRITFDHGITGSRIYQYTKELQLHAGDSTVEFQEAFWGGMTLGLSTVTAPLVTASVGSKAKNNLAQDIEVFLRQVYSEIEGDDYEAFRVRINQGVNDELAIDSKNDQDQSNNGASTKNSKFRTPKAISPFDPYMESVFVITTDEGNTGTGFFAKTNSPDSPTYAFTNAHVVGSSNRVTLKMKDGTVSRASVINRDDSNDIALLDVDYQPKSILLLSDGSDVRIGSDLIAIGTPLGLDWSVSKGILSQIRDRKNGSAFIQTDVAINPGNSGGPLIDPDTGKVVGIASFRLTDSDTGLNFGIHCSTIATIAEDSEVSDR